MASLTSFARGFIVVLLLAFGLAMLAPTPALAATTCSGTLGAVTIQGNLTVPNGANCTLDGTTVTGNVSVGQDAALQTAGATIGGNLRSDGAESVTLGEGTVVQGNVIISGTNGSQLFLDGIWVGANVTLSGNATVVALQVTNSTIQANLTVSGNTSNFGSPFIENNSIGANLRCEGNNSPPFGGGNEVGANKTGQCASL